jgi:hypothetical protein
LNDVVLLFDLMMNHLMNYYLNDFDDVVYEYNHVVFGHEYFVKLVELFQQRYLFDRHYLMEVIDQHWMNDHDRDHVDDDVEMMLIVLYKNLHLHLEFVPV